jgi:hypothetical protein
MGHNFHFFRAGGVDQVSLRDGADMLALSELDQQLWVALAMPMTGVALEKETLALLDHDTDGRIRVRDVLAAIAWAKSTFAQPGDLLESDEQVELVAIADPKILAAAKRMLTDLGKPKATSISVADSEAITKAFAETTLNGDGVVIPASAGENADLRQTIEDAIACAGSVTDRSGKRGIDQALADAFFAEIDKRAAWLGGRTAALAPLGDHSAAAAAAFDAVRAKIADYFTRCRVAAYDPRGAAALSGQEPELVALGARTLSDGDEQLAQLPLAKITPAPRLSLDGELNPAWAARMRELVRATVTPILGARTQLLPEDVGEIARQLEPYESWLAAKPATKVDALAEDRVLRLAGAEVRAAVAKLIASDTALADEYAQISAVAKTVRMQRDFGRILRNFVNFSDFYSRKDGVFQAGTLYIDARALHLCVPVSEPGKHGALAASSDTCLIYCDITRAGETKQIAAALTNGDVDNVFAGRNGVFYDRDGRDWDATVTKIVNNPISIRAAFWSPYKKLVKAIEDTVARRAQAAETKSTEAMAAAGEHVGTADTKAIAEAHQPAKPSKIDLGTIAAIGVAIGGIGTLLGALLANLFGLGRWLPIGLLALLMMISGPSMLLAWLKLRRRNLGPILDANGWAINGRARINVAFGAAMTELPRLPAGARRSLDDPFADKRTPWKLYVFFVAVLGVFGLWYLGKLDDYLPQMVRSVNVLGDMAPAYKAPTPK